MSKELTAKKRAALNRLKTVRGHLDGIVRMLESDAYCVDVMKQISAVQSSLERANRVMLHNHLETCFSTAVLDGHGQAAIEELIDAVKFTPALTGPTRGSAVPRSASRPPRSRCRMPATCDERRTPVFLGTTTYERSIRDGVAWIPSEGGTHRGHRRGGGRGV